MSVVCDPRLNQADTSIQISDSAFMSALHHDSSNTVLETSNAMVSDHPSLPIAQGPPHTYGSSVSIRPQTPSYPVGPSAIDGSVGVSHAAISGVGAGSSSDILVSERAKMVEERDSLLAQNQMASVRLEQLERREKLMCEELVRNEEEQRHTLDEVMWQEQMESELRRQKEQ